MHGYTPSEVDAAADVASSGAAPGAAAAAIRKLGHELGIPPQQLPPQGFKYLTRLHYCAADTGAGCGSWPLACACLGSARALWCAGWVVAWLELRCAVLGWVGLG